MNNDRHPPADDHSLETRVALQMQALDNFMENTKTWQDATTRLLSSVDQRVGIQNGNVARLTDRANRHDDHHGLNDKNTAERVAALWKDREDDLVRNGVYLSAWKAFAWAVGVGLSAGAGGLLIGKLT